MRARLVASAAVALSLVLSGCGGLPETGPVIEGKSLTEPINESPVRVAATGPRDGSSQERIVRDFLRAGEDSDESRQAGKLYLAPQSVDLWRWSNQDVIVYDGNVTVRRIDDDSVEVSTIAIARVSPQGRYTEQPAGTKVSVRFGMRKVGGEWRIDLPREGFGLWLDSDQFDRSYTARALYYVTPNGRDLVPDYRWFPSGSWLGTTLARAQLERVPDYLARSVTTGVPANTKLAVNAVPIVGGRAEVSLTSQALSADPDDRTAMWAQLTAALSSVSSVSSVSLAVGDTPLELPTGDTAVASSAELGYDTVTSRPFDTAIVRRGDVLTRTVPRYQPDTSVDKRRSDAKAQDGDVARIPDTWTQLVSSADGKQVAAISLDRQQLSLWRADTPQVVLPSFATSLGAPTYDADGYLWVSGANAVGNDQIYVLDARTSGKPDTPTPVKAPWLQGRRVVSLSVAADGARLLVVTTNEQGADAQLGITGIDRAPSGLPLSLATPMRQAQPLTGLTDVVWLDSARSTYAVLGRLGTTEEVRPWVGTVGLGLDGMRSHGRAAAESNRPTPVPGAIAITTVGGPRGIIVTSADGWIWTRAGSAWRQLERGTDVLVPGR